MGGFRRLLRCVFNPNVGVVSLVTLFAVFDGECAVADCIGVNQTAGSGFGNAGDAPTIVDDEVKYGGVSQRDAVCISKDTGGQFFDRLDTTVTIGGSSQPVKQDLPRETLCRAALFQDKQVCCSD